jgi:hypothetical protein
MELRKFDEERAQKQTELDLKKEDLDLRRKILQGEQASRTLQDRVHQLTIAKTMRELLQDQGGQDLLRQAAPPWGQGVFGFFGGTRVRDMYATWSTP